ncbi:MAG: hypothetical protein IID09_02810 [Candidatus Hydrogenedentes bacterium]|nr:hypothetical protein [Candidatus Hydrogenedentota bacterium]
MSSGMLSGCINHPSIEAVGRCKQCGKPFCGTCEILGPTGKFCSDACKERHEVFVKRASKLDDMRRTSSAFGKLMTRLKKVAIFAAAIIIIAVVLHFFGVELPIVSDIIRNIL